MSLFELIPLFDKYSFVKIVYKKDLEKPHIDKEYFYGKIKNIPFYLLEATVVRIRFLCGDIHIDIAENYF